MAQNNWANISTPDLMREIARHWVIDPEPCPQCHATLYRRYYRGNLLTSYKRCSNCQMDYTERPDITHTDVSAKRMLDEGAVRFNLPAIRP